MRAKLVLAIALVLVLATFLGCEGRAVGITSTHQIYEVVMNERMQDALTEVIVLRHTEAKALVDSDEDDLRSHIEREANVPDEIVDQLFKSAERSVELGWQPAMINASFVGKDEISSDSDWRSPRFAEDFLTKYPEHRQFYALSEVAFNEDRTKAAVVLSYFCPAMCGGGESLYDLEKVGMEWQIAGGVVFWIT